MASALSVSSHLIESLHQPYRVDTQSIFLVRKSRVNVGPADLPKPIRTESGRSECEFHVDSRVASCCPLTSLPLLPRSSAFLNLEVSAREWGREVEATPKDTSSHLQVNVMFWALTSLSDLSLFIIITSPGTQFQTQIRFHFPDKYKWIFF